MKSLIRLLVLATVFSLAGCDTAKHYFNKRISHPDVQQEKPGEPVDSEVSRNHRNDNLTLVPQKQEEKEVRLAIAQNPREIHAVKTPVAKKTKTAKAKKAFAPVYRSISNTQEKLLSDQKDIKGNDKEGIILLIVIAGLLVGLGILFYFLFNTVGLILLIIFSIAAGILLVLGLLALFL